MGEIHQEKGLKNKAFEKPDGLSTRTICSASGMSPSSLCSNDYYGYGTSSDYVTKDFKGGSSETCTLHKTYTICKESGKLATASCPADSTMQVVLAVDDDGEILGKPSTISDGKLDIHVDASCDVTHSTSIDPDQIVPDSGTDTEASGDDLWGNGGFGIQ